MQERLKALRLKLNLTQSAFASRIGTTQNVVANYEIGRRNPSSSAINNICKEFNVNETWLRTGEGDMFVARDRSDAIAQEVNRFMADHPDSFRERLISLLIRLDEKQWEVLEHYARQLVDAHDHEPTIEERVEAYRQELLAEEKVAAASSPSQQDAINA